MGHKLVIYASNDKESEILQKVWSLEARQSALAARKAKGYVPQLNEDGTADVQHMLRAVELKGTKSGDVGHEPGDAFNPAKASVDEIGMLELHAEGLRIKEIADALGISLNEVVKKFRGWKLLKQEVH